MKTLLTFLVLIAVGSSASVNNKELSTRGLSNLAEAIIGILNCLCIKLVSPLLRDQLPDILHELEQALGSVLSSCIGYLERLDLVSFAVCLLFTLANVVRGDLVKIVKELKPILIEVGVSVLCIIEAIDNACGIDACMLLGINCVDPVNLTTDVIGDLLAILITHC